VADNRRDARGWVAVRRAHYALEVRCRELAERVAIPTAGVVDRQNASSARNRLILTRTFGAKYLFNSLDVHGIAAAARGRPEVTDVGKSFGIVSLNSDVIQLCSIRCQVIRPPYRIWLGSLK
jgi:hypothetical protein